MADIYVVMSYYLQHQEAVEAYLKKHEQEAEVIRRQIELQPGHKELREQLLARRAARRFHFYGSS